MTCKILVCLFLIAGSLIAQQKIDLSKPPSQPEIFAENIVSTKYSIRDMAISPDGKEMFYTMQTLLFVFSTIVYRQKLNNGSWSEPEIAPFAGQYSDLEPAFSADGNKLYFASNRPTEGKEPHKNYDIWMVEKKNGKWQLPVNLGAPVNTDADEFYPSVAKNGNLYYTASYEKGIGKEDIFMSKWENGTYTASVVLGEGINSKGYEFNAFVSPDENFIIFTGYGRKDDMGKGDLYMSMKGADGQWQPAKHLTMLNSDRLDYCPFVSFDKQVLFFTSERHNLENTFDKPVNYKGLLEMLDKSQNGSGNVYWVSFKSVMELYK